MILSEFHQQLQQALLKNHTVVFNAECEINYSGRAESFLPKGDRTIMIKSDSTLLIHQPKGSTPVNYMKDNTSHQIKQEDDKIILKSRNSKEFMDVLITKIYFLHSQPMNDGEKIQLLGTERHMAEHIMQNPHLISSDFKPLNLEEHTKFGFIDVFGHNGKGELVVIECKRYNGDLSAVTQLRRYVEKIKTMKSIDTVKGVLACPKISPNALTMLREWGFEYAQVNPPKYLERFDKGQRKLL